MTAPSADDPPLVVDAGLWTIPNLITVVRLVCFPIFLWLLFGLDERQGAAWLLALIGATDWVDGYLARRLGQVSEIGKVLDPTADRIVLLGGVLAILIDGSAPLWFGVLTLVREGLVAATALALGALGARRFDVTWWGKTGTFLLFFAYPLFLAGESDVFFADVATPLAWAFGVPGLIISWYAAFAYVPSARDALAAARAERSVNR